MENDGRYTYAFTHEILRCIAWTFGVTVDDIKGDSRKQVYTRARFASYLILSEERGLSTNQIGIRLGKDHSTVVSGIRRARDLLNTDPDFIHAYHHALSVAKI